jgi:hypothetical protein
MENRMNQDEFEQFLHDEVKQHRMYPSDHIWKNVRTELHGYRAWPALTFISLFVITALTISTLISNHPHQPIIINTPTVSIQQEVAAPANAVAVVAHHQKGYFDKAAASEITATTFGGTVEEPVLAEPILVMNTISETVQPPSVLPAPEKNRLNVSRISQNTTPDQQLMIAGTNETANGADQYRYIGFIETIAASNETTIKEQQKPGLDIHSTSGEEALKERRYNPVVMTRPNHRFGFQVYVTPSTSYRKLSDEKVKDVIQPAVASNSVSLTNGTGDVNTIVRHRPAVGMEVGFALLYNMTGRLKFKIGAQLNVRQYYIETFQSLTSDLSTLSLINYRGVENVNFYSPYNNNTGFRKTQLDNKVYQVSIPVGIQWEAIRGKYFGVNAEASVQPTMTVNNQTYLLSTDYKHYTDGDQFIRKWNINTSVGLNLSYRTGSFSWQIGPQIRYQHLPTYSNAYPIKEHLLDYGVRVGLTKQLR